MAKLFENRHYQQKIHDKAIAYLEADNSNSKTKTLMIESPTGSGKTVMGMRLVKHLADHGHRIGWIAHRTELLAQAAQCNQDFFQTPDVEFISLFTRHPERYKDCTVVVIDEAQHDAAKSASILHDCIRPEIIIGLTATPYRTDKAQLCFQKVVRDAGIHQLIREGFLAEFNQFIYDKSWTPVNIATLFVDYQDKWGKSVIYFLSQNEAKECCYLLREAGVKAGYVVGDEPREETLEAYKKNKLQVLTNVAVLTEGWDDPEVKTAFVRPSSKGPTVQMAGRAFRKHPDLPIINVIQNLDTKYPFTRHATAYNQFIMEGTEWRSIDPKNLNPILIKQRRRIVESNVILPEFLKIQAKNANRFYLPRS